MLAALPLVFTGSETIRVAVFPRLLIPYNPEGFRIFISIAIKAWLSVQAALLLASTTTITELLSALQQMRVPNILVAIIGLMLRYLHVIRDEALRMMRARACRSAVSVETPPKGGTFFWRARVTGGMAGSLFVRSIERSERIYAAMLSRGYSGVIPASSNVALSGANQLFLLLGFLLLTGIWLLGVFTGG